MQVNPASTRSRTLVLLMVCLLAWLPMAGMAMPGMPPAEPAPAQTDMPCHSQVETPAVEKHCDMPRLACECCDQAVQGSLLPVACGSIKPRYLRMSRGDEPFVHAPDAPLSQRYRPPRT